MSAEETENEKSQTNTEDLVFSNIRWVWPLGYIVVRSCATVFFDFKIVNRRRAWVDGGAIYVCNHQSYLDPPLLGLISQDPPYFLGRKTLFTKKTNWFFYGAHTVPVDLEGSSMSGLKTLIRLVNAGRKVVIFPEGARSLDGKLQPAKPGVSLIIRQCNVPVVPMRLFGAYNCLPRGSKSLSLGPITCVVGDPVTFTKEDFAGPKKEAYARVADRLMQEIAAIQLPSYLVGRHAGAPDASPDANINVSPASIPS